MDPTFVVLLSLVVFMGIAYHLGYRQSMAALDHKIATVQKTLEEAAQAKEAAIQALQDQRRYHEEIQEETALIAQRAEEQALTLQKEAMQDIDKMVKARQKAAADRLKRIRYAAIQTIQEEVTAATLAAFKEVVATKFSPPQQETLNDEAIAKIVSQLTKSQPPANKRKRTRSKRATS